MGDTALGEAELAGEVGLGPAVNFVGAVEGVVAAGRFADHGRVSGTRFQVTCFKFQVESEAWADWWRWPAKGLAGLLCLYQKYSS